MKQNNTFRYIYIACLALLLVFALPANSEKPDRKEIVQQLFRCVEEWMGTPYVLGGMSKSGIDCSGFVVQVYQKVFKKNLPRTVARQKLIGQPVKSRLQPGDLLFFNINGKISHIGIYVFDQKFIHAASAGPQVGIIKSSLKEKYYQKRYSFAKRIIQLPKYQKSVPIDRPDQARVTVGNILYRGEVFSINDTYWSKKPLYIEIKPLKSQNQTYLLRIIKNSQTIIKEVKLDYRPGSKLVRQIILPKGLYELHFLTEDQKIIKKNEIIMH